MITWIFSGIILITTSLWGAVRIESFRGPQIAPYHVEMTKLCYDAFSGYPYLYEAAVDEYGEYLHSYEQAENALICLAFDGGKVVGLAQGIPMPENREHYRKGFGDGDLSHTFYFGELIVHPDYSGKGLGTQLVHRIEELAKEHHYAQICFVKIDESLIAEAAPENYFDNTPFWIGLGYQLQPEKKVVSSWKNIGAIEITPHTMLYWVKSL